MSGGFGPILFCKGARLGGHNFGIIPWAALCEIGWSRSRIYKAGVGRVWADKLLQGVPLGGYNFGVIPWAGLCEIELEPKPDL